MAVHVTGSREFLVNTFTTGAERNPVIAALTGGGWVTSWESSSQDGSSSGIYQQRFDANGHPILDEGRVNTEVGHAQDAPTTTSLADGGWVTAWASYSQDGDAYGIYQQRYNQAGTAIGGEVHVSTATMSDQDAPSITALANNSGWLVTWASYGQDGSERGIYQQRYAANGDPVDGETLVNSTTAGNQAIGQVAGLDDGGWVVAWLSDNQTVFQQHYGADGKAIGEETRVNATTTGHRYDLAITDLHDGGWVVTWSSDEQDGDLMGIYQQRYDENGNKVGGETLVNSTTSGEQSNSTAIALADGGWLITWEGEDGSDQGIFQQRYDKNGNAVGGETQVNIETAGQQKNATATALDNGGWVVTWQSDGQDGDGVGVYQRYFAPDVEGTGKGETLLGTMWDETLRGFGGNDRLDGGQGDDVMIGGGGNDTYVVSSAGDIVQELAGQGNDTIEAEFSIHLKSFANVENVVLTGGGDINVAGTGEANRLTGNAGANRIDGLGGNDRLTGGDGADTFVFKAGYGQDTITDFETGGDAPDLIDLSRLKSVKNFADLEAHHLSQHRHDVWIDGGNGDVLVLKGVDIHDLGKGDFLF